MAVHCAGLVPLIIYLCFFLIMILIFVWYVKKNPFLLFGKGKPTTALVINMDRSPERYEATQKQLLTAGIMNYQRFPAVDGKKMDKKDLPGEGFISDALEKITPGEIGCAASHVRTWKYIAQHKMDWTLVLEDDVIFHPNFKVLLPLYLKKVPDDATIIYLGSCGAVLCDQPEKNQRVVKAGRSCTHAYMIDWKGAQYLLDHLLPFGKEPFDSSMDHHFRGLGKKGTSYALNGCVTVRGIRPQNFINNHLDTLFAEGLIFQDRGTFKTTVR